MEGERAVPFLLSNIANNSFIQGTAPPGEQVDTYTISRTQHSENLLNGLNDLRSSDKLFDVTLLVEGRTFKAHRVVLAACSDYFCAMFTDAMRESRQNEIKLTGLNAQGVKLLIEYAYTSNLELNRSNVQEVLAVASHIQMKPVVEACSKFLETQIDLENCVGIAALGDMYCLDLLRRKAYRYICSRLNEFAQTPDLLNLTFDQMDYILACNYPVDSTEERVLQIVMQYCMELDVEIEKVRQLVEKIHFVAITQKELKAILYPDSVDPQLKLHHPAQFLKYCDELRDLIVAVSKQQHAAEARRTGKDVREVIPQDVLVNSRGMELALVKIGGFETNGLTNQISCYLPSTGKWTHLTVIPHIEQCNYGTALLGNDLFIVGGSYDVCLKEYIHPFGFRYCPAKHLWKSIAPIQSDRCRFSLNAVGDVYLYAVGGVGEVNDHDGSGDNLTPDDNGTSNCERYNSHTNRWEYMSSLPENRSQHAGAVLGNKLYVSGGMDRHVVLSSLWSFDTTTEEWTKLAPMPTARADHVLIASRGNIYACGGWYEDATTETRVLVETIDVYNVEKNVWEVETRNPTPRYYSGVTEIKNNIYFIGGLLSASTINRTTSAVDCYNLDSKKWIFDSQWDYPKEVWECTSTSFYVPRELDDFKYYWADV